MTLIVGLIDRHHTVLVSDRRLTRQGVFYEDESNKALVFVCRDGRLAVAFTGLAELAPNGAPQAPPGPPPAGYFLTRWWILSALGDSAPPDCLLAPSIERFRERATRAFRALRVQNLTDKGLTVVFAGYKFEDGLPRTWGCVISNLDRENPATLLDEFAVVHGWQDRRPGGGDPQGVFTAGTTQAVSPDAMLSLRQLLERRAQVATLVGHAVKVIRDAAASPASRGVIGDQCTSIVLPSDPALAPSVQYHSAGITRAIYGTSLIVARSDNDITVFAEPEMTVQEAPGGPSLGVVPRVGRNKPCPCGSRKKYKRCHGRVR